jgi:hypothetical protein
MSADSSNTYKAEIHKLYHLLSQFKLYNNPDKLYLRKIKVKRIGPTLSDLIVTFNANINSFGPRPACAVTGTVTGTVTAAIAIRKKMKHNDDPDNCPDSLLSKDLLSTPSSDDDPPPSNIIILKTSEYEKMKTTKYSLTDLRSLCIHYGIKRSGTKPELTLRIYTHLKQSYVIVKIQRYFRQYISAKYRTLSGPGYLRVKKCVNDTDFYTFDKLSEIAPHNLFTFLDRDGKIYGFHIASIYNLIMNSFPDITNPYNRNILPVNIIRNVYDKLIYGTLLKFRSRIKLDEPDEDDDNDGGDSGDGNNKEYRELSKEKQEELYIFDLFQHINRLGNYSDSEWFTSLQRADFLRFIRNIHDIWYYRANLSQDMKERICPPHGNPFTLNHNSVNLNVINLLNDLELRSIAVSIISNIVKRGVTREDQCLGAFYVLATLTIVNQNARNALPWLYEAVI